MRRLATSAFAASMLGLVAIPAAWVVTRPEPDAGSLAPLRYGVRSSQVRSQAPQRPIGSTSVRVHPARLTRHPAAPNGSRPVAIRIEALGLVAGVVPVGVEPGGGMEIPDDVNQVGWYRFGSYPGAAGSTVLDGHVDSRAQGPGAFFGLRQLSPGQGLVLRLRDGRELAYRVIARRLYPKGHLPQIVFRRDGASLLALVTCGGPFDPISRHYRDNVVVFALPAGARLPSALHG